MRHTKRFVALFCLISVAVGQDAADPEAPDPKALLTDAILNLRAIPQTALKAQVKHHRPDGGGMFGGAVQIVIGGMGGAPGKPFEGGLEAWRDKDGSIVMISDSTLPGFKLYMHEDKVIQQATFETAPAGLRQIQYELGSLIDPNDVIKHLTAAQKAGELKAVTNENTGDVTFTGTVPTGIVTPVDAMRNAPPGMPAQVVARMFPQSRILETTATIVVSKEGKFKSIAIKVVRNDPRQEMMRKFQKGGVGGVVVGGGFGGRAQPGKGKKAKPDEKKNDNDKKGDGAAPPPPGPGGAAPAPEPVPVKKAPAGGNGNGGDAEDKDKDAEDEKPIKGGSTTYTLTFVDKPSDTAVAFKKKVLRMLGG